MNDTAKEAYALSLLYEYEAESTDSMFAAGRILTEINDGKRPKHHADVVRQEMAQRVKRVREVLTLPLLPEHLRDWLERTAGSMDDQIERAGQLVPRLADTPKRPSRKRGR